MLAALDLYATNVWMVLGEPRLNPLGGALSKSLAADPILENFKLDQANGIKAAKRFEGRIVGRHNGLVVEAVSKPGLQRRETSKIHYPAPVIKIFAFKYEAE